MFRRFRFHNRSVFPIFAILDFDICEYVTICNAISDSLIDEKGTDFHRVLLTDTMDKPDLLSWPNTFDGLLRGFQETPARMDQPSYNPLVRNFILFNKKNAVILKLIFKARPSCCFSVKALFRHLTNVKLFSNVIMHAYSLDICIVLRICRHFLIFDDVF